MQQRERTNYNHTTTWMKFSYNTGPKSQTQENTHIPSLKTGKLIHADDRSHNRGHSGD